MACLITIARLLGVLWRLKYATVILCRRLALDALLRDLLHHLWRIGLVATSPIRWEACLPWMSPGWMSPLWGCSILHPIWGIAQSSHWKTVRTVQPIAPVPLTFVIFILQTRLKKKTSKHSAVPPTKWLPTAIPSHSRANLSFSCDDNYWDTTSSDSVPSPRLCTAGVC